MSEAIAVPDVLALLAERLRTSNDVEPVRQALRVLQRLGLPKQDLIVHVERLRVANDLSDADPTFEERALLALGLIHGDEPGALRWDAGEQAAIWLQRALDGSALRSGAGFAVQLSDLLPPRPSDQAPAHLVDWLVTSQLERLQDFEPATRAEFFRVPKVAFSTRPAALLALPDRLNLEALASLIEARLPAQLADQVKWPRTRSDSPPSQDYASEPLSWQSPYIVKADVTAFYEAIDHSLLAVIAALRLRTHSSVTQALEFLLGAVMGTNRGLPQGPAASDVLATLYLTPVDDKLASSGWPFIRYADDYFIAAQSPSEARSRLAHLETWLQDLGLSLSSSKTQIMKRSTYERGLLNRTNSVERVRERVRQMTEDRLLASEDSSEVEETLRDAGVDEDLLFAVLYHQTTTLEELLEDMREQLAPSLVESYAILFHERAHLLETAEVTDDATRVERELRECLIVLASGSYPIRLSLLDHVLEWFPKTTPHVATYLAAIADRQPEPAIALLNSWLRDPSHSDWTTGWVCHTAERSEALRSPVVLETFESLMADQDRGWLTRTAASRVLALADRLTERSWKDLYAEAPPAIKSELAFSVVAARALYPWSMPPEIGPS